MLKNWFSRLRKETQEETDSMDKIIIKHLKDIDTLFYAGKNEYKTYITTGFKKFSSLDNKEPYVTCYMSKSYVEKIHELPFQIKHLNHSKLQYNVSFEISLEDYDHYFCNSEYKMERYSLENVITILKENKTDFHDIFSKYFVVLTQIKSQLQAGDEYSYEINKTNHNKISFILDNFKKDIVEKKEQLAEEKKQLEKAYNQTYNQEFEKNLDVEIQYITR